MESWISISQGIYKHFRDIVGLITDEQNPVKSSYMLYKSVSGAT